MRPVGGDTDEEYTLETYLLLLYEFFLISFASAGTRSLFYYPVNSSKTGTRVPVDSPTHCLPSLPVIYYPQLYCTCLSFAQKYPLNVHTLVHVRVV